MLPAGSVSGRLVLLALLTAALCCADAMVPSHASGQQNDPPPRSPALTTSGTPDATVRAEQRLAAAERSLRVAQRQVTEARRELNPAPVKEHRVTGREVLWSMFRNAAFVVGHLAAYVFALYLVLRVVVRADTSVRRARSSTLKR